MRKIVNKRGPKNALGESFFQGNIPKKVLIYKGSHGDNKKVGDNRIGQTIMHEEHHLNYPHHTEKQTYKATNATKWKNLSTKAKKHLYNKYNQ